MIKKKKIFSDLDINFNKSSYLTAENGFQFPMCPKDTTELRKIIVDALPELKKFKDAIAEALIKNMVNLGEISYRQLLLDKSIEFANKPGNSQQVVEILDSLQPPKFKNNREEKTYNIVLPKGDEEERKNEKILPINRLYINDSEEMNGDKPGIKKTKKNDAQDAEHNSIATECLSIKSPNR